MFRDTEIIKYLETIQTAMNELKQAVAPIAEKLEYLAAAEEARATHSKKPVRKAKVEEEATNATI